MKALYKICERSVGMSMCNVMDRGVNFNHFTCYLLTHHCFLFHFLSIQLSVPVAQSVERWTSCGLEPRTKVRGSRRDRRLIFMSLLMGMVAVGGRP